MELLIELSKDVKIKEACKKIGYPNHEDLYQELFIILCELPTEKLQKIKQDGYLHYWVVRTLLNITSPRGSFYKKYYIINDEGAGEKLTEQAEENEQLLELESKRTEIEKLLERYEQSGQEGSGWYKVNLLKQWIEVGSSRKLSKLTGICYRTICKDINDFTKELRTNLNNSGC